MIKHTYLEKDNLTLHHINIKNNSDLQNDKNELPFPLGVIPNGLGIKLAQVDSIDWITQDDGQITDLTFYFMPTDK